MKNRFLRFVATTGLVVAGLAFDGSSVDAAFTVSATAGGSALGGATYANLDSLGSTGGSQNGLSIAFAGNGGAVQGSVTGLYAAPNLTGGNNTFFGPPTTGLDTTTYASTGGGSATLTFASGPQSYLGLLWGSVDTFNTLSFFDASNTLLGSFSGASILAADGGVNPTGTLYVNVTSSIAFSRVVASSVLNSFEFDNVAYANVAVPEPSSLALCGIAGLIGVSVAKKRTRRTLA